MYLSAHPFFQSEKLYIRYNKVEMADSVDKVEHPVVREALKQVGISGGVEITSTADVPPDRFGSSSSFTVGMLHALYSYRNEFVSKERLAQEAAQIEIERLGEPIGKQDQYAAAYGGLNCIRFHPTSA